MLNIYSYKLKQIRLQHKDLQILDLEPGFWQVTKNVSHRASIVKKEVYKRCIGRLWLLDVNQSRVSGSS